MQWTNTITPEESVKWEEYYKTERLIFQTQFKGGRYISGMVNGFNAYCFVGTWEEYEKATEPFNNNQDLGKIIGTETYSLSEWEKIHKKPEPKTQRTYLQFLKEEKSIFVYRRELKRARELARYKNKQKKRKKWH